MTTRHGPLAAGFSLLLAAAPHFGPAAEPARAQQAPPDRSPAAARLSSSDRASAMGAIRQVLAKEYVFPEMRAKLVERLSRAEKDGRYDVEQPHLFAERITEDLRDVARDGHLWLQHAPAQYAAAVASPASDRGSEAFAARRAVRSHHGLAELRILPGNIRYLKVTAFEWIADETGIAYDGAMRFLRQGDAAIIDLRGNGGGHPAAVQYLISHFLPPDTLLLTFHQGSETPIQSRTLNHLPAGRLRGKPLYVLIDGGVASAAEELAYHVQQFKLGELVGRRTAGGANNNRLVPVAPAFLLSVSVGRPVHAVSGTNWEGEGIAPTVEAPSARALEVAESMALARLAEAHAGDTELTAEYAWARPAVEARLRPVTISAEQLRRLAGDYGEVRIELREGALWLVQPEREARRLLPMTADGLFAVEALDVMRVRFRGKALELLRMGAPKARVFPRSR
ncbi:MAG TPA: S41 family peptidase [Gemmatimonadales bacterium]